MKLDCRIYKDSIYATERAGTESLYQPNKLDKMRNSSNFECTFCGKVNNSRQELTCHMTVHTKERDFNCTECSKSYTTTGALIYHINSVHEKLKFACPVPNCGKSFADSYYLKHHIDRHDPESSDNSVVSCPICKQKLKKISLANHVYRHTAQKKHKCPSCNLCFQNTWALKQHQRVHLPLEKRQFHPCNMCDFKASKGCYLKLHKEVKHSQNRRSYSCTFCERNFNYSNSLQKHLLRHTGEKPYSCTQCDKSFIIKSALNSHAQLIHTEKKYKCSYCPKAFGNERGLIGHQSDVHEGKRRSDPCPHCGIVFTSKSSLKTHLRAISTCDARQVFSGCV